MIVKRRFHGLRQSLKRWHAFWTKREFVRKAWYRWKKADAGRKAWKKKK
jgi:hypothetical protein